ncbi:flagellar basal-body MS-ring/collar protein FliF [Allohahella sp. A8]|uniref:flagellar basal-body MS-ring/collar protein FliF n=1 Tax=Allohahella sp. A8 TaxID=3141461 RepID=UPI000C0A773F|nr:flagellar M-ring protein FliF [Hahellaceae bacterium]|tara:strand:+ start:64734 stop:66440 length:1707 start_codon:yes stop_codon:yes gene_type:complete
MSTVPAELPRGRNDDDSMIEEKNDTLLGLNRLSVIRQLILMVGVAASIALGIAIIMWASEPSYRPLFNDMSSYDPTEVAAVLQQDNVAYKIEPNSGALLIAAEDIHRARLKLASMGITQDKTIGFELLDQESGLGTSQFMETTRYRRGLEGELVRTITSIRNVKGARVHLAIPKQSVFIRDPRKPSASVFLELTGSGNLNQAQVEAIVNLVASSVPELESSGVTVVDQKGNLLSQNNLSDEDKRTSREFAYARKLEEVLSRRIYSILEPVLGAEKFRAEVSADVDFSTSEQAAETYNPDLSALRSEQQSGERRIAGTVDGVPGALANQPPGAGIAPEVATAGNGAAGEADVATDVRTQSVRNYEVDRTVSYTRSQLGRLERLSVAVVVDDIRRVGADGTPSFEAWPAADLERLTLLVRDAVGYSASRGDSVNVINTPFMAEQEVFEAIEIPLWEQDWFGNAIKWLAALLIVLVLVFFVVRPTIKGLASGGSDAKSLALAGDDDGLAELERLGDMPDSQSSVGLSASGDFLLPGASDSYEKQVNALKGLIAEDPGRVAQVVRTWVLADE